MESPRRKPARGARLSKRSPASEAPEGSVARAQPTPRPEPPGSFRGDCEAAIAAIRDAVRALCAAIDIDPLKPQEVARRLKLNKNLTWKFARVLIEQDALDAAPMLPGPEGVAIYLRAFESAHVPDALVAELRDAIARFDATVARHFGGRADFELVLDGLRSGANLEQSRRLAFRGAAAVFGVQVAARVTAQILAPNKSNAALADVALLVGIVGLRRLRPIAKLPVFRSMISSNSDLPRARPLLGSADGAPADFLVREFSSVPGASVSRTEVDGKLTIELNGGPIGRIGEADLFFTSLVERAYARRASPDDKAAQFISSVSIPSESFVSDLFVHRSIEGPEHAESAIFAALTGPVPYDPAAREAARIPIDCTPIVHDELPGDDFARLVELANVPNYATMLRRSFEALGEDPRDYRLIRVAMTHPPMPSALVVRWPLPE